MGQTFGDQVKFLASIFGISCAIAAYWMIIPYAAQLMGLIR